MPKAYLMLAVLGVGLALSPVSLSGDDLSVYAKGKDKDKDRGNKDNDRGNGRDKANERSRGGPSANRGNNGRGASANRGSSARQTERDTRSRGSASATDGTVWVPPGQLKKALTVSTSPKVRGRSQEGLASVDDSENGDKTFRNHGELASALGALNAAHASENALRNASPNSRVGRIAAYREEVLNGQMAEEELAAAEAYLGGLEEPDRSMGEVREDLQISREKASDIRARIERLEERLAEAGGSDTEIEARIARAEDNLEATREATLELRDELDATRDFESAKTDVDMLTEEVELSREEALKLLEEAANKEVTEVVQAEVNSLLGLPEPETTEEGIVIEAGD